MPKGSYSLVELSYTAGFIDADGYISINRYCPRKEKTGTYGYNLRIGAVNTNKKILLWFQRKFGGFIYKRQVISKKHKQTYAWYLDSKKAEGFLRKIYPYLRIKKDRADIAFKFRKTFDKTKYTYIHKDGKFIDSKVPSIILKLRVNLRDKLKFLNRRGMIINAQTT